MDESQPIQAALSALATQGWQVSASEGGWLLQREAYTVYADINARWLYFSLPVLQTQPAAYYLQASRRLYLCKYSCDPHGQLLLQAELPLADLERTYIHTTVEALWRAAQQHDLPLVNQAASVPAEPNIEYFPRHALDIYFKGLRHEGWGFRKPISVNEYHFHYKAPERPFEVYLAFNAAWAYWQVPILEGASAAAWWRSAERETLCRYLLAVNEQLYWARFALDNEGNVLLLLDVPLSLFTLERFRLSAQAVAQYAADYAYEVLIMSELGRDEALARFLTPNLSERLEFHN
ncbi:MAG: YbjN domain-containing protein [Anaerolineae bacterium]|nr:YbjN domain-containing protein [Anaerolineae bacterium]MDW8299485.1 YbjN domain-containing protein [Anaerolineae bacterium]